ncbi:Hint domain-containing protein [Defluviimonas sp. SAOS-178_SWC]|uniref:Hint domain-containing protein n=1 Tax=Defluviimonas sp. SAOS-178_SWC TaxID=3121287 RepID=UPI0032216CB5
MPIEGLCVGDRVLTRDNGYRPIRWIGARRFDGAMLANYPEFLPVRIAAGALGDGRPARDIVVSPQHRMLLTGAEAMELAGESEILLAAVDLIGLGVAEPACVDAVVYVHILFDAHEIVSANGCWSESFLPEAAALDGLHPAQRREILTIFPELANTEGQAAFDLARAAFAPAATVTAAIAA